MKKIPTIFVRDWAGDRSRVLNQVTPGCEWVFAGEGIPTEKLDGTCCMIRDGKLYKRREIKPEQTYPADFEVADRDYETGKTVGWVPVGDGPEDKWNREAFANLSDHVDGTYELIGPNIQGNKTAPFSKDHILVSHKSMEHDPLPVTPIWDDIKKYLSSVNIEGIVWHHPDGRMAKIKRRDFGLKW